MATPAVDQTYGQRSVFGALGQTATAPVDDDLDCEDEQDALAYLMMVRSEANKIPHVMVAPRPGPQAFPTGYAEAKERKEEKKEEAKEARRKRNKRRQRHWDDQDDRPPDDANGDGAKRRRTAELSYDEVSYDDLYDERVQGGKGKEDKDDKGGKESKNDNGTDGTDNGTEDDDGDSIEGDEASIYHRQALYETGVGDTRGYYHDGAYVAAEDTSTANTGAGGDDAVARDAALSTAYRARLLSHFADMRAHLAALSVSGTACGGQDTDVGPLSVRSGVFKHWLHLLRTADARPEQVAAMDKISVLRLLRIVQRGLAAGASTSSRSSRAGRFARTLAGGPGQLDMSPRTIRWLWALLARLPDRGELDYREVGYIRDVAKQVVMRLAHLSYDMSGVDASEGGAHDEDAEYMFAGGEGEGEDEGEEAKEREQGEHAEGGPPAETNGVAELDAEDIAMDIDSEPEDGNQTADKATAGTRDADDTSDLEMQQRAALEMVLVVAGEFYGQRDLLEFRSPWAAK